MYGMSGNFIAQPGKRDALVEILLQASSIVGQFPGCRLYVVNEDLSDDTCVRVVEIWEDKESHDASLRDERVRSLIAEAMPLMGGMPEGVAYRVVGGYGLEGSSTR